MTFLIGTLGRESGTAEHLKKVISLEQWDKAFVVTDAASAQSFNAGKAIEFVVVDESKMLLEVRDAILQRLHGKIADTEVALNLVSGTGKLHMATLSAALKLGLAIRLVTLTPNGVAEA